MYFKIIHLFYPVKHFLSKFKKDIDVNCSFCSLHLETVPHIFWHCSFVRKLWYDVSVGYLSQKRYSLTLYCILKMSFLDILFKIM